MQPNIHLWSSILKILSEVPSHQWCSHSVGFISAMADTRKHIDKRARAELLVSRVRGRMLDSQGTREHAGCSSRRWGISAPQHWFQGTSPVFSGEASEIHCVTASQSFHQNSKIVADFILQRAIYPLNLCSSKAISNILTAFSSIISNLLRILLCGLHPALAEVLS